MRRNLNYVSNPTYMYSYSLSESASDPTDSTVDDKRKQVDDFHANTRCLAKLNHSLRAKTSHRPRNKC